MCNGLTELGKTFESRLALREAPVLETEPFEDMLQQRRSAGPLADGAQ